MNTTYQYPKFRNALFLILFWIVLTIPFTLLLEFLHISLLKENPVLKLVVISSFSLGLTIWIGFRKTKLPFLEVFPLKAPPLLLLIPLILISTGGSVLCSEIDNIFRYFVPVPQFFFEMLKDIFNPKFVVASFLAVCVLAPISEEFLLRGIILKGFLANYSKWKAILLSALLFSLMHMNPLQFVSTFLVGIFAAWLITRTNNLTLTVILHFFFNFLPWVLINFTSIRIPGFSDLSSPLDIMNSKVFQPLWLDGLGLFLLISGFFILNKLLQDTKAEPLREE